jgi:dinuclear metal center YbgI/SA1388 family protein
MIERERLIAYLNDLYHPEDFEDAVPNGLQIEGKERISHIVTSPSISMHIVEEAVRLQADAILVHHGLFWKSEPREITGSRYAKISHLIRNGINLMAYHLPMDAHAEFGNNRPLLASLGCSSIEPLGVGYTGLLPDEMVQADFFSTIDRYYSHRSIRVETIGEKRIRRVAMLSGAGAPYIVKAIEAGCDAFVTGEGTEWAYTVARDHGIALCAVGHYRSETTGPFLIGGHLQKQFSIRCTFLTEENPF